jgi:putative transposase
VIVTKYRRKILNDGILAYVRECLKRMVEYYPVIEILKMNHDRDHIHFLMSIPPKIGVGKVVGIIKANMARDMKKKFPFLREVYWGTESIWSGGYFVSTVGVNEEVIGKYIEAQGREDAGQAKLEF